MCQVPEKYIYFRRLLYDLCLTSVIMKFSVEEEKRLLTTDIMFCFFADKAKEDFKYQQYLNHNIPKHN